MINLLPIEMRKELNAGRSNTLLVRYVFLMLAAVVFILLAVGVVYLYLINTKASIEKNIADNKQRSTQFATAEKQATDFRSNLATAKQILNNEVSYTKIILNISALVPKDVVLDNLNLDASSFGTATVITAKAKSSAAAISLKSAFEKSDIFSDVHFQTISIQSSDTSGYPYLITMSAIINKEAVK